MLPTLTLALALLIGPGPQDPAVETLVDQLNRGRLVLEQAPFKSSNDQLEDGSESLLQQTARALSRAEGRFVVFVPAEQDPAFPPDTVLSRRRAVVALQRLIAAGSNPKRLVLAGPALMSSYRVRAASVAAGRARIELVKVQ